jgi:hypothetical protein
VSVHQSINPQHSPSTIDQSINLSITQSNDQTLHHCLRRATNVVSSRRLVINRSIDRSISPINHHQPGCNAIDQSLCPINQSSALHSIHPSTSLRAIWHVIDQSASLLLTQSIHPSTTATLRYSRSVPINLHQPECDDE